MLLNGPPHWATRLLSTNDLAIKGNRRCLLKPGLLVPRWKSIDEMIELACAIFRQLVENFIRDVFHQLCEHLPDRLLVAEVLAN